MNNLIINHKLIAQRYFFPLRSKICNPFYVKTDGAELSCAYYHFFDDAKTIIHFHGNGEVVADYENDLPEVIKSYGCNLFLSEYRGYSLSTGEPLLGKMLDDIIQIVDILNINEKDLIFFGRSVGSIFAIHGAYLYPESAGLIIESGIADVLERLVLRVRPDELDCKKSVLTEEVDKYLNHKNKIKKFKGRTLIMHSRNDGIVEKYHGENLYKWANEPKKIKIFEQGDHNSIYFYNRKEYHSLIKEFIDELQPQ